MISRERLEELIEQGATVYSTSWKEVVQLNKATCSILEWSPDTCVLVVYEDEEHSPRYHLKFLEEDWKAAKKVSEWKDEFYTYKTLEFKPVMWDEIKDKAETILKSSEDIDVITIQQFFAGESIYSIHFVKCEDNYQIKLTDDDEITESFELSETGYELAVLTAKDLFLGK